MLDKPETPVALPHWSLARLDAPRARDKILRAGSLLFCRQGFSATGIDAVIEASSTAKATLYKHFTSKHALIEAVLDAEGAAWRSWFFGRLSQTQGPADQKILAVFDVLEEWFADPHFYGCAFINAVAEFDDSNGPVRAAAARHKAHIITWLTAQAIELDLPNPQETTRSMIVLIDGAIVAAQHTGDASFAKTARTLAQAHLSSQ